MEPPRDQPPRRTKRPLPGTAGEGSSSRDDTGFLDERGSFVERAARGGTKEEAWLGPDDADAPAAAATATKRARKALRKQEEDERLVEDLVSARAVFEIRKRIVGLLWPGETVPRALRRLKESGQAEARFPGATASASTGAGTRGSSGRMDEATRRAFDELTDAAAELVERGDHDAYSHDREEFERAAWVYEYGRRRAAASAAQEAQGDYNEAACTAAATVDMFGDDDVDAGGTGAKTAADSAGGQAVDPDQPAAAAEETDEGAGVAGWDYVYDPATGYYYSSSTGYYYDAASGCYGSASTGTWFSYNDDGGQWTMLQRGQRDAGLS